MSLFGLKIEALKGIGQKRATLFEKLGVPTAGELLRFYPRAYEDMSHPVRILQAPLDAPCAIRARVISPLQEIRAHGGMLLYKLRVTDDEADCTITFFNNPYVRNKFHVDETYLFYGRVTYTLSQWQMNSPAYYTEENCPPMRAIYRQTQGLTSRMISSAAQEALRLLPEELRDPIPAELREKYELCTLRFALEMIHFPEDADALEAAKRRLIFEELLVLQLGLIRLKGRTREKSPLPCIADTTEDFWKLLPFSPTNAQKRAVQEAVTDMQSGYPMNRLVQGDVGSGKTAVAAALCYVTAQSKLQAALMAPTEILAEQHYAFLSKIFASAGVKVGLLTGSTRAAQRKKTLEELREGTIQIMVGTHALFSDDVQFQTLGLVITDEQHRFGVTQRASLTAKGPHPHTLVMSATPIPRTLALMIYGDLSLSILDELPPGRQPIHTYAIGHSKRLRAFGFLQKQVDEGRQCYIICPAIEEGENDMASVNEYADKLEQEWLPHCRIGRLHGRMKAKEKNTIMEAFAQGNLDILVSTTVVEVGVDVPNATVMLIENAERYGLSQLHQLRGRVGRGQYQSHCILVSDAQNQESLARLRILCETSDGFRIADEDLKLRGPGDFFGSRQHGLPDLKIADMMQNMETLKQAQEEALAILRQDAELEAPEHRGLRAETNQLFNKLTD